MACLIIEQMRNNYHLFSIKIIQLVFAFVNSRRKRNAVIDGGSFLGRKNSPSENLRKSLSTVNPVRSVKRLCPVEMIDNLDHRHFSFTQDLKAISLHAAANWRRS